jgi:hypothetical protein
MFGSIGFLRRRSGLRLGLALRQQGSNQLEHENQKRQTECKNPRPDQHQDDEAHVRKAPFLLLPYAQRRLNEPG